MARFNLHIFLLALICKILVNRKSEHDLFLLQTFTTDGSGANENCPFYKWIDITFELLGKLPCVNAMRSEPFIIDGDVFVAIANNRDEKGKH